MQREVKRALMIANGRYADRSPRDLPSPVPDAEALASLLGHPDIGGFEVEMFGDRDLRDVAIALEKLAQASEPDDMLLVFLSGHGTASSAHQGLLFHLSDSDMSSPHATSLRGSVLKELLSLSQAQRSIVIMDYCFSGALDNDLASKAAALIDQPEHFAESGRAVMMSSTAKQRSFEFDDPESGMTSVFTRALVAGIESGDADLDKDGLITLDELFQFARGWVRQREPSQTPLFSARGMDGRFVIARSLRQDRIAHVPVSLRDAAANDYSAVRLAAATELARFVSSTRPERVKEARAILRSLRTDPDPDVVEVAVAALRRARRRSPEQPPEPREVMPGEERSTNGTSRVVRVDRSALAVAVANACSAASTDEDRPAFQGCQIRVRDGLLRLASTDAYRIALDEVECTGPEVDVVVGARTLLGVPFGMADHGVSLRFGGSLLEIEVGEKVYLLDYVPFDFPDYEKLLHSATWERSVTVLVAPLREACTLLAADADRYEAAVLTLTPLEIVVTSSGRAARAYGTVPIVRGSVDETYITSFNPEFVLAALSRISETTVVFDLSSISKPACIRPDSKSKFRYYLMPIRTQPSAQQ